MKKAVSLVLVLGIVAALFSLAACGEDKPGGELTSLMEEGSTLLDDVSENISENLSEALSDEGTTEEESTEEETSEDKTSENNTTEETSAE